MIDENLNYCIQIITSWCVKNVEYGTCYSHVYILSYCFFFFLSFIIIISMIIISSSIIITFRWRVWLMVWLCIICINLSVIFCFHKRQIYFNIIQRRSVHLIHTSHWSLQHLLCKRSHSPSDQKILEQGGSCMVQKFAESICNCKIRLMLQSYVADSSGEQNFPCSQGRRECGILLVPYQSKRCQSDMAISFLVCGRWIAWVLRHTNVIWAEVWKYVMIAWLNI